MQSKVVNNEITVSKQLVLRPFITLLLPFEPKMTPKHTLEIKIRSTLEKIKNELYVNYSFAVAKEVFDKLLSVTATLDYNTHKKSVVVLVSSDEQKILYLDFNVANEFYIESSFQIRQLVRQQKDGKEYLLLVLDSNFAAVYRGQNETLSKILLKVPDYKRLEHSAPDKFYKNDHINNSYQLQTFLQSIDQSLSILLNAFSLPVFILGPQNVIDVFRQITHNKDVITCYVEGDFSRHSEDEVERAMQPYLNNWQSLKEQYYKQLLEGALENGKLSVGIENVWKLAKKKNAKLLVVEEGYEYQAYLGKGLIVCAEEVTNNPYIKDAVEDAIENVLSDGGNVAFVSNKFLSNMMHIAAIRSY